MAKKHLPVPENEDIGEWRQYINSAIPLVEESTEERRLSRFREESVAAAASEERLGRTPPINPARYEGRMGDYLEFAYEHFRG